MLWTPFGGDPAATQSALDSMKALLDSGGVTATLLTYSWDDGTLKASPSGALGSTGDRAEWAQRTGMPSWIAYAIDAATMNLSREELPAVIAEFMAAVQSGVDLELQGSSVVLGLLSSAFAMCERGLKPQVVETYERVVALHQAVLDGQPLAKADWRKVRTATLEMMDSLVKPHDWETLDMRDYAIAKLIEAAAWSVTDSATVVGELVRLRQDIERATVDTEYGWSTNAQRCIHQKMKQAYDAFKAEHPDEHADVFRIFERTNPVDYARMKAFDKFQREHQHLRAARVCRILSQMLWSA